MVFIHILIKMNLIQDVPRLMVGRVLILFKRRVFLFQLFMESIRLVGIELMLLCRRCSIKS